MKSNLTVGKVLKPRGLKGEMRIETFLSSNTQLAKIKNIKIDNVEYTVEHISLDGAFGYIQLLGVDSVEKAEALRGREICVNREQMPKLPDGKYYIVDMIGLDVFAGGERVGEVVDISQFGSADVYTLKSGDMRLSFPAIPQLIKSVDLDEGKILVDDRLFQRVVVYN